MPQTIIIQLLYGVITVISGFHSPQGKDSGRYRDSCDQITGRIEETCCARILCWNIWKSYGWLMVDLCWPNLGHPNREYYDWRWFELLGWQLTSQDSQKNLLPAPLYQPLSNGFLQHVVGDIKRKNINTRYRKLVPNEYEQLQKILYSSIRN